MGECRSIKQAVRVMVAQEGITQGELAGRMSTSESIFSRTLGKPDHRIASDLLPIAAALGCTLELRFIRPDGSVAASVGYKPEQERDGEE